MCSKEIKNTQRRKGYGRELLNALFLASKGTDQNKFTVHFPMEQGTMAFFEAMGFELLPDMALKYVTLGDALASRVCRKNVLSAPSDNIKTVSSLDAIGENAFAKYMKKKGFWVSTYYDPDFSTVCFDGEKISSVMLTHAGIGVAAILWMDFNPNCQKELFMHMGVMLRKMEKDNRFNEETKIFFAAENEKFVDIVSRLSLEPGIVKTDRDYILGARVVVFVPAEDEA